MTFCDPHGSVEVDVVDGAGYVHDLEGDGSADLAGLVSLAREWLKGQGVEVVFAYTGFGDTRTMDTYRKRWGMEPVSVVLRGAV